jgi:hypothetical protein
MNRYILMLTSFLLLASCGSFKKELFQTGGKEEAVKNAILDFSNTSSLYKKDTVFSVSFQDPLYRMVLEKVDDGNSKWIEDKAYEGIIGVNVSADNNKIFFPEDAKIGSKGKLPSRYIEKDGKLFYWWDDNYPLKKETLTILNKYNILEPDKISALDFSINDAQKGVHYFFCKDELSVYKKITTNKAIGYYDIPNIKCNE